MRPSMARRKLAGNHSGAKKTVNSVSQKSSFAARGGWWVAAQIPLLIGALLIPGRTGTSAIEPISIAQWLGIGAAIFGLAFAAVALIALGKSLTPFPAPRDAGTLKTDGPYRWVRHPIYAGLTLATLGWALWWLSAVGVLYGLALAFFFDRKAVHEERWLREKFADYAQYQTRVRKLVPGVY